MPVCKLAIVFAWSAAAAFKKSGLALSAATAASEPVSYTHLDVYKRQVMFFVAWFWIFFEGAVWHDVRLLSTVPEVAEAWAKWPPCLLYTSISFNNQLPCRWPFGFYNFLLCRCLFNVA